MNELDNLRKEIDKCDDIIVEAYIKRLNLVEQVGEFKKKSNVNVLQTDREKQVLDRLCNKCEAKKDDIYALYTFIMDYSKKMQSK